jgi:hypothetical protein
MEKSCNSATFGCQPVVCRQRGISLFAHDRDAACFKQGKCLGRDTQAAVAAAAEDHQIRLVVQQLCHVTAENAWSVIRTGFAPIPRSPAAGPKLDVAEPAEPLYFDEAPTVLHHPGRRLVHRFEASAPVSGQNDCDTPTAAVGLDHFRGSTFRGSGRSRLIKYGCLAASFQETRRGSKGMHVLIWGAGIGGLAPALMLGRLGWKTEVVELFGSRGDVVHL